MLSVYGGTKFDKPGVESNSDESITGKKLRSTFDEVSSNTDFIGELFGGKKSAKPRSETKPPPTESKTHSAKASAEMPLAAGESKSEVLRTVAKAASKAIIKSVALSLAVLGPGFAMLMIGMTIPGMIWLFFGSFGLMAWTYRKPWRLGLISCLMPPAAAGICYVIQLLLFGAASPPIVLLVAAIGIGMAVGYWRARTHDVKEDENGAMIAERTIGYLIVWVAAYGITQTLALVAADTFAVRAGLITGAFSTAMLAIVSILIWRRSKIVQTVSTLLIATMATFSGLPEGQANQATLDELIRIGGRSGTPSEIKRAIPSGYEAVSRKLGILQNSSNQGAQVTFIFLPVNNPNADAFRINVLLLRPSGESPSSFVKRVVRGGGSRTSCGGASAISKISDGGKTASLAAIVGQRVLLIEATEEIHATVVHGQGMLSNAAAATCGLFASNLNGVPSAQSTIPNNQSVTVSNNCIAARRSCQFQPGDTCGAHDCAVKEYNACRSTMGEVAADALYGNIQYLQRQIRQKGLICKGRPSGNVGNSQRQVPTSETEFNRTPPLSEGIPSLDEDEIVAATVAITTVLIAAGIAINVAQAITAAIANALQAGVQLTSEEIQAAISDAILNRDGSSSDEGSAEPDTEPESNAPPNVRSTERVRPPTPIYDEHGNPFETNEDGKYLAPDNNGDWRWLSKAEAEEAAASLRQRQAEKDADLARHRRETEDNLDRSSEKMRAADDRTRTEEKAERERSDAHRRQVDEDAQKEDPRTNPEFFPADYGTVYQGATFISDWGWSAGAEVFQGIRDTPGAIVDATVSVASAAGEVLTNPENWKSAGNLGADIIGSQFGHLPSRERLQERADKAGELLTTLAGHATRAVLNDPFAAAGTVATTMLGKDNWEKVVDPNVPITERVGRALWGGIDTGGLIYGPLKGATKVGGKISNVLRVSDTFGDATRGAKVVDAAAEGAKAADKTSDLAAAARAADKTGDGAGTASKVDSSIDAATAAEKTSDGTRAAGRAARNTDNPKPRSLDELREKLANQKRGGVENPGAGPNIERHGIPGPKTDPTGYIEGLPTGALVDQNLAMGSGWSGHQIDDMARFSKGEDVIVGGRLTNLDSLPKIRDGTAVPKDVGMKSKTISEIDARYLGAKSEDKGLVGFFEPKEPPENLSAYLPENIKPGDPGYDDALQSAEKLRSEVRDRFDLRNNELSKYGDELRLREAKGEIILKDGKVYKVTSWDEAGEIIDYKPVGGDIDGVYFRDRKTGKIIGANDPRASELKNKWMGIDPNNKGHPNYWKRSGAPGQHGVETNLVADIPEAKGLKPGTPEYDKAVDGARELHGKLGQAHIDGSETILEMHPDGHLRRGLRFTEENPLPDTTLKGYL